MKNSELLASWSKIPKLTNSPYTDLYAATASAMKWSVVVVGKRSACRIRVTPPGGSPFEIYRHNISALYHQSTINLCKDKRLTHKLLLEKGIATPRSIFVRQAHAFRKDAEYARLMYPLVVKPIKGTKGIGVTVGVHSEDEVVRLVKDLSRGVEITENGVEREYAVIQETIFGMDYRVLLLDGRIVDVVRRVPAHVTGDGVKTTLELVMPNIVLDHRLGPFTDIPHSGEIRYVQHKANVSLGGVALKCNIRTIHSANKSMFLKVAKLFPRHRMMGIDFMGNIKIAAANSKEICRQFGGLANGKSLSCGIIELNASPQIFCHCIRESGIEFNVLKKILLAAAAASTLAAGQSIKSLEKSLRSSLRRQHNNASKNVSANIDSIIQIKEKPLKRITRDLRLSVNSNDYSKIHSPQLGTLNIEQKIETELSEKIPLGKTSPSRRRHVHMGSPISPLMVSKSKNKTSRFHRKEITKFVGLRSLSVHQNKPLGGWSSQDSNIYEAVIENTNDLNSSFNHHQNNERLIRRLHRCSSLPKLPSYISNYFDHHGTSNELSTGKNFSSSTIPIKRSKLHQLFHSTRGFKAPAMFSKPWHKTTNLLKKNTHVRSKDHRKGVVATLTIVSKLYERNTEQQTNTTSDVSNEYHQLLQTFKQLDIQYKCRNIPEIEKTTHSIIDVPYIHTVGGSKLQNYFSAFSAPNDFHKKSLDRIVKCLTTTTEDNLLHSTRPISEKTDRIKWLTALLTHDNESIEALYKNAKMKSCENPLWADFQSDTADSNVINILQNRCTSVITLSTRCKFGNVFSAILYCEYEDTMGGKIWEAIHIGSTITTHIFEKKSTKTSNDLMQNTPNSNLLQYKKEFSSKLFRAFQAIARAQGCSAVVASVSVSANTPEWGWILSEEPLFTVSNSVIFNEIGTLNPNPQRSPRIFRKQLRRKLISSLRKTNNSSSDLRNTVLDPFEIVRNPTSSLLPFYKYNNRTHNKEGFDRNILSDADINTIQSVPYSIEYKIPCLRYFHFCGNIHNTVNEIFELNSNVHKRKKKVCSIEGVAQIWFLLQPWSAKGSACVPDWWWKQRKKIKNSQELQNEFFNNKISMTVKSAIADGSSSSALSDDDDDERVDVIVAEDTMRNILYTSDVNEISRQTSQISSERNETNNIRGHADFKVEKVKTSDVKNILSFNDEFDTSSSDDDNSINEDLALL